ncbi:MAG TPA: hypothetical protein DCG78_00830 [Anaerolineaceae bacterium]|nr:MAG: hypothetical protein XD89_0404 [Anaerolineae bacterium 49_20]HAE85042.1 hypothetical protein [Anaerolineaceae bacterium]
MISDMKPLIEVNQQAIHLLYKELGVVDAVRFLRQFTQGFGNYTQERETMFADKSFEDIVNEIEQRKKTAK